MKNTYKINFTMDGQIRYQTSKTLDDAITRARGWGQVNGVTNVSITLCGKLIEWAA